MFLYENNAKSNEVIVQSKLEHIFFLIHIQALEMFFFFLLFAQQKSRSVVLWDVATLSILFYTVIFFFFFISPSVYI